MSGRAARAPRRRPQPAPAGVVVRLTDATGTSPRAWEAAVLDAVAQVSREHAEVVGVEVMRFSAELADGTIRLYRASVRVAYREQVAP